MHEPEDTHAAAEEDSVTRTASPAPPDPPGPTAEDPRARSASPARRRSPRVIALAVVTVLLGALGIAVSADVLTASPQVCMPCHELDPRVASWEESAHSAVPCVKCHQTPREWYELPQRLADRGWLLGRDIVRHFAGGFQDPVEERLPGTPPMQDVVCLQCHSPDRTATSGFRILIDHPEHARRNGSCVSCHVRTAHPVPSRGGTLTLMAQCFTCHGTPGQPEASAECGVCHPSDYELYPSSHNEPTWMPEHGSVSASDPRLCDMCHTQESCSDCHGLAMPHPEDWAADGHSAVARVEREICVRCHADQPDMCASCHHVAYDERRGTWLDQHALDVNERGAAVCFECHAPVACVECHVRR